eukprot:TRINITY_DN9151_c0_g1::TRINITY_DN9151_c0_g1_i1::g.12469::m.12469 TRINITY_DN9151_c0_g1::TRINITY_DN9151_c0_g1_i1::g.12469  ORF type:complete len:261 (+),score=35.89,sp/P02889/PSMD8_DICDI/39.76/8e-56,PCI_Csn8/PF10075.4/2e-25,SAC3_GANP/PF03399.11/3.2e-24 TRINITY_DN9151_c0_g1_i1:92-874(+)
MNSADALLNDLRVAYQAGNLSKANSTFLDLKLAIATFPSLFPGASQQSTFKQEVLIAREALELGTLLSLKQQDINGFERNFLQLKPFYFDYVGQVDQSPRLYLMLGLNLLRLLVQNRIAEFHTELELIPIDQHDNPLIKLPLELEQYLMEGSYSKVIKAQFSPPDESYSYFLHVLQDTVRTVLAECSERAYDRLSLARAKTMFFFQNKDGEFDAFVAKNGWTVENGYIHFRKIEEKDESVPAMNLIQQTLQYAKELERVV